MTKYTKYNNIILLDGINTHPGSGNLNQHLEEIKLFEDILDNLKNKKNPIMIEIGCFWALWSLIFKSKYIEGKNILIELNKRALDVGETNFKLNNFEYSSFHGGFCLETSGTYKNKENDILYPKNENEFFNDNITGDIVGEELNLLDIFSQNQYIDLLHMDIQGSEKCVIEQIIKFELINKIENIIICTHSNEIHNTIIKNIQKTHEKIIDVEYGKIGGDGYLYFKLNKT
jgi:FkbM family methyltransferase